MKNKAVKTLVVVALISTIIGGVITRINTGKEENTYKVTDGDEVKEMEEA